MTPDWAFACPRCRQPLEVAAGCLRCPTDGTDYTQSSGVWDFLLPEDRPALLPFVDDYERIRLAEGRAMSSVDYYRALPFAPPGSPRAEEWAVRARSYKCFMDVVLGPSAASERALAIADLGAGNGWLSYRLAQRGHHVLALDLTTNDYDGLGCLRHYDAGFTAARATFNHLPLLDSSCDLVVFNAALHYSTDYAATLRESLRVLRQGGLLAIIDTPVYNDAAAGRAMLDERAADFAFRYGSASDTLPVEGFLTLDRLDQLSAELGVEFNLSWPDPTWRRRIRAVRGRARHGREVAQFPLIITHRPGASGYATRH